MMSTLGLLAILLSIPMITAATVWYWVYKTGDFHLWLFFPMILAGVVSFLLTILIALAELTKVVL